jgi:hypothetical protein
LIASVVEVQHGDEAGGGNVSDVNDGDFNENNEKSTQFWFA